jgi:D-alanyl-D-alanine carboxypeptidase
MRSGLFSYTESPQFIHGIVQNPQRVWAPDELLALAFAHPPNFPPGQGYEYSNTNTVLEGRIIEKLTGQPLETVLENRIFKPLGLTNTYLPKVPSNTIANPHPQGYEFGTLEQEFTAGQGAGTMLSPDQQAAAQAGTLKPNDVTNVSPSWGWAAGGVISTAPDLATYLKALVGGGVLMSQHLVVAVRRSVY